jgi:hypothetical protein
MPETIDWNAKAREYGLVQPFYGLQEGLRVLRIKHTLGAELVQLGELKPIYLTNCKPVLSAVDMAKFLHRRETQGPLPPKTERKRQLMAKVA